MKWDKFFATVVLLSGPCCLAQAPMTGAEKPVKQNPLFSIALAPPDGPVELGSPILVTVTVTNISGKDALWASKRGQNLPFKEFRYLLMKDGREIETAVLRQEMSASQRPDGPQEAGSTTIPVPPGVVFLFTVDLRRLYEIKKPGVYTLEVSRFDESSKTIVHSNDLTLDIASR